MVKVGSYVFQWFKVPVVEAEKSVSSSLVKGRFKGVTSYIGDNTYRIYPNEELMKVVKLSRYKELTYTTEIRDCDDYSFFMAAHVKSLLPGVAFGIVWGDILNYKGDVIVKHAINFYIDESYNVRYIEPQNNEIFKGKFRPFFVVM